MFNTNELISDFEMYVYLSYLPRWSDIGLQWLNCDLDCDFGAGIEDEKWWIQEGVKAWKQTMVDQIASTDQNAIHVVPLSGGLDSRAILGGLLENLPTSQIVAATYGIPGAWDFEIAKLLTRKFGIRHELFDLTDEKWEIDALVKAASRLRYPVSVHQSYVRQKMNNYFGRDCVYWSGLMGDTLAGSDLPEIPNTDKRQAVRRFVSLYPTHHYKDQSFQDDVVKTVIVGCPWDRLYHRKLTLDQQIDMGIRQNFLTRPIVLVDGFCFKTPFLSKTWGEFILNVPYQWLRGYYLYKKTIIEAYKELSALPCRATAGMPLSASKRKVFLGKAIAKVRPHIIPRDPFRSHPRTNYINFTEALRHRGNFQDSVYTTLQDLKKREIFSEKEIDYWWFSHLKKKADCTILLTNLSSLELLLKAGLM